jgi:ketosteroid isomerase-like protein
MSPAATHPGTSPRQVQQVPVDVEIASNTGAGVMLARADRTPSRRRAPAAGPLALAAIAMLLTLTAILPRTASAHPPAILNSAGEKAVAEEIIAFRNTLADAVRMKDAVRLRELYAPSFVHTHTSGKLDGKDARIVSALAGDPVIETAETSDLVVRIPNDWTAIVTGLSPIVSLADGKTYAVRWLAVYARTDKSWQLAASQATRSHEIKP